MEYIIIRSKRKTISLSVDDNLNAVVRAPYYVSEKKIREFAEKNSAWVENARKKKMAQLEKTALSDDEIEELISKSKEIIIPKVEYYSGLMGLSPTGIKITKAKKRFGSCSAKNSLCFSCFLIKYPEEAIDYVVVHELAHIKHHNHGKEFYSLIKEYLPDYKEREKLLKA